MLLLRVPCICPQVAAINCTAKHCVLLGDVFQRLVVSPNVWQLMSDAPVPEYVRELHNFGHPGSLETSNGNDAAKDGTKVKEMVDVEMVDGEADVSIPNSQLAGIKIKDEVMT